MLCFQVFAQVLGMLAFTPLIGTKCSRQLCITVIYVFTEPFICPKCVINFVVILMHCTIYDLIST